MSIYHLYQDKRNCIGCHSCTIACKTNKNLLIGPKPTQIIELEPRMINGLPRSFFLFMPCFHCENAWCEAACPTGAIQKRSTDGIVYVDSALCVGCKSCISACPWGAPQWNSETGKAVKCDYCMDRLDAGLKPACVTICTTHCLHFGKVHELADIKRKHYAKLYSETIIDSSLGGLGQSEPNPAVWPLLSSRDTYFAHIRDKRCPAIRHSRNLPAACHKACPAGIDVPSYVALISHGMFAEAVKIIRENNPFPWVCGLVCPAPCEKSCRRGDVDESISIRALKGFASKYAMEKAGGYETRIKTRRNEKVAIIGSGPAGLTAAYYLAVEGYNLTVFEALPEPGGMLRVGIPPHRLPKDLLDREIDSFRQIGIKIKTNTPIGSDLSLDDLFNQGFGAVFLSIGAHKPISLGLPGEDAEGGIQGVDYLRRLNLGQTVPEGKNVVVIGGGNVAVDVARSAVRKKAESVTILYRRTEREMPAFASEVEEALEEGVTISYLTAPESILTQNQRLTGIRCIRMKLGKPDKSGRRRPVPVQGSEYVIEADLVIPAIGQTTERSLLDNIQGIDVTRWGTVKVDPLTLATGRKGLFAGGDAATGPATVIEAIAAGKKAATAIDAFIRGIEQPKIPPEPLHKADVTRFEFRDEKMRELKRPKMPLLAIERRLSTFEQVELGLTEEMARDEAKRCLRCDLIEWLNQL